MFVRPTLIIAGGMLLAAAAPNSAAPGPASFTELLSACEDKDGWRDPAPPVRIDGNIYYVGTCGISVVLVTSPQGHVLFDTGEADAVPLVLANIRRLGFDPRAIKWLFVSHVHFDHVGRLAEMKRATGAKIAALPDQARELARGEPFEDDPQHGKIKGIQPVKIDRVLTDGMPLRLGPNRFTAFATPGHTRGSTSWVIRGCGRANCPAVAYADSTSAISADGYRFTDHPAWVAMYRRGVARIGTLPCAIVVTPHPGASTLFERFAGDAPLTDPAACKRYADFGLGKLDARLAKEAAAR